MKTTIIAMLILFTGILTSADAQSRWKPDPGTQISAPDEVPAYLSRTETVFGADFDFTDKGAVIKFIYPNTPAETFNFRKGDIVTNIGNTVINSENAYRQVLETYKPEESVSITFTRKGAQKQKKVVFDKVTVYKKAISQEN